MYFPLCAGFQQAHLAELTGIYCDMLSNICSICVSQACLIILIITYHDSLYLKIILQFMFVIPVSTQVGGEA